MIFTISILLCYVIIHTNATLLQIFRRYRSELLLLLIYFFLYRFCNVHAGVLSGPLMVITQKVTSLAYSIHDGLTRREEELTPMQRHQAVQ